MRQKLAQAAELQGMRGRVVEGIVFAATRFAATIQLDVAEDQRRRQLGLTSVTSHELLKVLGRLPHGHPVPWTSIDPVEAAVLDVAPAGVVDADPVHVRRSWRPAVAVTGVLVVDSQASSGLDAASLFAPDARRTLVVCPESHLSNNLINEAVELGVGIVRAGRPECELVAHARPALPARASARHWRFLETVYQQWLQTKSHISAQASR